MYGNVLVIAWNYQQPISSFRIVTILTHKISSLILVHYRLTITIYCIEKISGAHCEKKLLNLYEYEYLAYQCLQKYSSNTKDIILKICKKLYIIKEVHCDAYHTILPTFSRYTYQWATFPEVNNLLIVKRKMCQWILTLLPRYRFILAVPNFPLNNKNTNMILC